MGFRWNHRSCSLTLMRNFRNIILVGCKLEKYEWHLYDNDSGNLSSRVSFLSKEKMFAHKSD